MDELAILQAYVRAAIGSRVQYAHPWRVDELTRLVVRFWPHRHLEEIAKRGGKNHKAVDHTMTLVRAQVRERWEAEHGLGPLWQCLLGGTVGTISTILLARWWAEPAWRERLRELSGEVE